MSDKDKIRSKTAVICEFIKHNQENARSFFPTSEHVIKAITSRPQPLKDGGQPEEITADDYDEWIYQAFLDLMRKPRKFHTHPDNPALIECPRLRLLRIGEEAEREGKPSKLFRYLMQITNNGTDLPRVTNWAMSTAQKYLNIAIAFKQFVETKHHEYKNFKDLKLEFRRDRENMRIHVSESTLERVLREHDLDWSAYAIGAPRKGKRGKRN